MDLLILYHLSASSVVGCFVTGPRPMQQLDVYSMVIESKMEIAAKDSQPVRRQQICNTRSWHPNRSRLFQNAGSRDPEPVTAADINRKHTVSSFVMARVTKWTVVCFGLACAALGNAQPNTAYDRAAGSLNASAVPISGVPELVKKLGVGNAIPRLKALLENGSPWERIDAADGLRQMFMESPKARQLKPVMVDSLVRLMNDPRNPFDPYLGRDVRFNAAYALLRLDKANPTIVSWCTDQIANDEFFVRENAVMLLARTESANAVPALVSILAKPNDPLVKPTIEALGDLGARATAAIPTLRNLYTRSWRTSSVRTLPIVEALAEIGDSTTLLKACTLSDSVIRATANEALEKLPVTWQRAHSASLSKCKLSSTLALESVTARAHDRQQQKAWNGPYRPQ
jgi:hypothetical protein